MIKHINIEDFETDKTYEGIYICNSHNITKTKAGKNMVTFQFGDRTGTIDGVWWDPTPEFLAEGCKDADFIGVRFTVSLYNDKKQAKVLTAPLKITPNIEFDKSEIIPIAPISPIDMYNEIYNTAAGFTNAGLNSVTTTILTERKEELLVTPGAKSVHHAVVGGLLFHTLGMLRLAKAIAPLYPNVNVELLYAGVILHDICKIDEFTVNGLGLVEDYSTSGKLLGHITMGVEYLGKICDRLNIPEETAVVLKHMIESHHGIPEHGSALPPMFIEAVLLHEIDYIDSRNYIMQEATKDVADHEFSQRVFALDNTRVFKHNINE